MIPLVAAVDRAARRAIETGLLTDLRLIHRYQQAEGHQACFGRMQRPCPHARCRWHRECMELMAFVPRQLRDDEVALPVIAAASTLSPSERDTGVHTPAPASPLDPSEIARRRRLVVRRRPVVPLADRNPSMAGSQ